LQSAIIVHGGAGDWNLSPDNDRLIKAVDACRQAAQHAQQLLMQGASALDAVEAAVRLLEDCPILDAGRGSYLNRAGAVEMDAMIMNGNTLEMGAVGAIQCVRHPISLARRIMNDCEHTFLVAGGADAFAEEIGFPRCEVTDLLAGEQLEKFRRLAQDGNADGAGILNEEQAMGTVGAVARDSSGNLAVATSTGGTRNKRPGRIGDSPLVGSGAYADNWTAAASATGHGEALMKIVISRRVCEFVAAGLPARDACHAAIRVLAERVQGHGGIIAVDARGNIGHAYNTAAMPYAFALGDGPVSSGR